MPPAFLAGTAAAAGIAMINSIGNLGGFVGPYLIGVTVDQTRNYKAGLFVAATSLLVGAVLTLLLNRVREQHHVSLKEEPDS
jgi:ACS family tartrate transporter-like MFS transporter